MEVAKRTYEVLNSELHDELPALYDSRALFLVTNMQTLFAAEEVFHTETSKVRNCLRDRFRGLRIELRHFRTNERNENEKYVLLSRFTANWKPSLTDSPRRSRREHYPEKSFRNPNL